MPDDLIEYYDDDLTYLRTLGRELAEFHPSARRLGLNETPCDDPHVERLLEGVALLTSRVRRKIDDEFPEITDALLGLLYPDFQRPVPSMIVAQLAPDTKSGPPTPVGETIEPGLNLRAAEVDGVSCQFRTVYPVTLWPLEVAHARLEGSRVLEPGMPAGTEALVRVTLAVTPPLRFEDLKFGPTPPLDRLRFYLGGSGPAAYVLHEFLLNHLTGVAVRPAAGSPPPPGVPLGRDAVQPVGYEPEESMIPGGPRTFPGHRLLQDYFALPEKFLFFDLVGLHKLAGQPLGNRVEVLFFLNRAPRAGLVVGAENFLLGCTPAVNLFPAMTAAIPLTHARVEYPVVADLGPGRARPRRAVAPGGGEGDDEPGAGVDPEVFSVDRVVGVGGVLGRELVYEPFFAMRHAYAEPRGRERSAYWYASRRESRHGPGTDVFLSFVDSAFDPHLPAEGQVTVQATCTNRDLPARLPTDKGPVELRARGAQAIGAVRCVRNPTRSYAPPLRGGAQWRLISCLALNHLALAGGPSGAAPLQELLDAFDFTTGEARRRYAAGISGVSTWSDTARVPPRREPPFEPGGPPRVLPGGVCRGVRVHVRFDESKFAGNSAFLLASVLDRFLAQTVSFNAFTRLVALADDPRRTIKEWPPRTGLRTLL